MEKRKLLLDSKAATLVINQKVGVCPREVNRVASPYFGFFFFSITSFFFLIIDKSNLQIIPK